MIRIAWIVGCAAIGLTMFFLFLGAVAYQSGDSISVAHQQSVLNSFGSVLRADLYGVEDRNRFLQEHKILESPEVAAFILDENGSTVATSWSGESPFGLDEVVEKMAANPDLKPYERVMDIADARLVWLETPLSADGHLLVLVHQCVDVGVGELTELYVVPIGIAAILVVWATFWAGMAARRMIRNHAKQQQLEVDLLRHLEAGRIRSSFLANMSHELRTPLNAVIGYSEMLKMQVFGPLGHERNVEYVDYIHLAGEHMLKMVSNLLDLSRIESGSAGLLEETVAPASLLEPVGEMFALSCAEKHIEFEVRSCRNLPSLYVDPAKVKQILFNLCWNSLAHTPADGTIRIGAQVLDDGRMTVEVSDTGTGIEPEELDSIVEHFGHPETEAEVAKAGAGVGLPLSQALMQLHGGSLELASVAGKGTTVRAIFPAERTRCGSGQAVCAAAG